jgi:hypothetical protein
LDATHHGATSSARTSRHIQKINRQICCCIGNNSAP